LLFVAGLLYFGGINYYLLTAAGLLALAIPYYFDDIKSYSFTSLFLIGHGLQFVLPFFLLSISSDPTLSISYNEFLIAPQGILVMLIGIAGFNIGTCLASAYKIKPKLNCLPVVRTTTLALMFLALPIYAGLALALGSFYHVSVGAGYNVSNANSFGFIGYFFYIAVAAMIYASVLSAQDIKDNKGQRWTIFALCLLVIFLLIMVPSGQRRMILLPFFVISLIVIHYVKLNFKNALLIFCLAPAFILSLPVLEMLRSQPNLDVRMIFDLVIESSDLVIAQLVRRLADFVGVAYIYDGLLTGKLEMIGFADLLQSPLYFLPTAIRPEMDLVYTYDALIAHDIGFRSEKEGSSPIMFMGDLLIRGGVLAVLFGCAIVGVLLSIVDRKLDIKNNPKGLIIYSLFIFSIASINSMSILKIGTFFTRHFLIYIFIAEIIMFFNRIKFSKDRNRVSV